MLNIIGRLVAWLYHLLFDRADQRAAMRASAKLRRDIEREWISLLSSRDGRYRALPDEKSRLAFDYGKAIFDFDDFNIEVIRGRGEINTRVSAKSASDSWLDLDSLIYGTDYQHSLANTLPELASLLQEKWLFISSRLSKENLSATRKAVLNVADEALEQLKRK